ncbi:MAG TPA: NAD(P)-dependent alcohol dehydrogenase [Bacteroidales bacterium]|nr:NAD(P)-dependent alcohol dehydrogenase [Bacteroidales bacterium]HNS46723.1 NAD(P)-dependent alcohol dehydrogenase [Bacteroidales bacterium]
MEKMKAVVYNKKARPDKLVYGDVDKPVPGENEVLIKIHSVSLNAADYRSMKMGIIPKRRIFGADIAGRVESVGQNISLFKPGDEVMGDLANYGFGGLAEYATVPGIALIIKPGTVSFDEAAAIPMAALTALQALRDKSGIKKGHYVLIVGSGGGVGTFAIQLAKFYKAEVTGVCSSKNVQQTLSLGADHVIDYTKENFTKSSKRYDLILGINGNYPLLAYRKMLSPGGTYVMIGGSLSQIFKSLLFGRLFSLGSKQMKSLMAKANRNDLAFLGGLLENGIIKPVIGQRYPLEKASEAMDYLRKGHAKGKVVIQLKSP